MSKLIGFTYGSWGDVIIHMGYIEALRPEAGPVIYYGENPHIARFIAGQHLCTNVIHIRPSRAPERLNVKDVSLRHPELFRTLLIAFSQEYKFNVDDVVMSFPHGSDIFEADYSPPICSSVRPSPFATNWAEKERQEEAFVILQPFSFKTNKESNHWAHWNIFITTIIERYPNTNFVLMGSGWDGGAFDHYGNVQNMIDKTPSVDCMYAMSDYSSAVITCSNSLAHYCTSRKTPTLVCASYFTGTFECIFSKVLRKEHVRYVGYTDSLYRALHEADQLLEAVKQ